MHSIRRAAARAASSSAPLAMGMSRQQILSLAMRHSRATTRPAFALPAARAFSQSIRFAQDGEKQVVEEATQAYEQETSTATTAAAEEAVAEQEGTSTSPATESAAPKGHGVYVSNMTFEATEEHLREAFGKYGEITEIFIGRDERGLSRGFGFVTFTDKDVANRVVDEAHNSFWHGRRINVAHRVPRTARQSRDRVDRAPKSPPTASLYIGNIPYETSDADLNKIFREMDNVTDVRVAVDRNTGWPRGFAHADFADVESAQNAAEKLRNVVMKGRKLRVDFSVKRDSRRSTRRDEEAKGPESEEL